MTHDDAIAQRLEIARRELLDLTGRNRLLNTQRSANRSTRLEIIDEISQEVFRHLVSDGKAMSFLSAIEVPGEEPVNDEAEQTEPDSTTSDAEVLKIENQKSEIRNLPPLVVTSEVELAALEDAFEMPDDDDRDPGIGEEPTGDALPQPDDDEADARHTDDKLQTMLSSEKLQKRLLKMYYDARTFEEEQGVNILFLALGFLKWNEPSKGGAERFAPLILVPVSLSRRSARTKFRVRYDDEEVITNLSLQEKLKVEFSLQLPALPDNEGWLPNDYFDQVEATIQGVPGWEVLRNDIVMWFFSFSKFLMYRDLQTENWPTTNNIQQHPLIQSLLTTGFRPQPPICGEGDHLDRLLDPMTTIHVTDADSSQSIAIEEVRQGRNLIIQGPPGTGKSQTITNLIGAAVKEGRKVLFVAEKMAALEVVKRRLDALGIGITCLELHSHKASKRAVLRELDETLRLGRPNVGDVASLAVELRVVRDELNRHAESMCTPLEPSSVTPFQAIGELVRLRQMDLAPPDFDLPNARDWTANDLKIRLAALHDLVEHLGNVGNPKTHLWRGVGLGTILPTDQSRIQTAATELLVSFEKSQPSHEALSELLAIKHADTQQLVDAQISLAKTIGARPEFDSKCLLDSVWAEERAKIGELVGFGLVLQNAREKLNGVFADLAWTIDVREIRQAINAHGRSFWLFRIFNGAYRRAISQFKGLLVGTGPRGVDARVVLLDLLIAGQDAQRRIESDDQRDHVGQRAFGDLWRGVASDLPKLRAVCDWESACGAAFCAAANPATNTKAESDHRSTAVAISDRAALNGQAKRVEADSTAWRTKFEQFAELVKLDVAEAFGSTLLEAKFVTLHENLSAWPKQVESITHWIDYRRRCEKLRELSHDELASRIHVGSLSAENLIDQFELKYFDEMARVAFARFPHLAEFNGTTHESLLERFSQLDRDRMLLARREVARAHHDGMPISAANIGQVGVVRREIQKKRMHLALRRLLRDAGRAVQAIKPVFMMSPTSIAQFLEPGRLQFDLLVIDEASQVTPVDAFGAIARAKQIVVVGDDKQLPPTRFFQRVADDGDAESHDEFQAGHMESILSLCAAQNVSQRMLRWHYRSRHHSLIEVSNEEFYNEQLYVIPSPEKNSPTLGLKLRFIEQGVFDRGGSATNQIEASAVADAVIEHARQFRNQSLGVGTFSVSQRDAVLDELERRRREAPELEPFFAGDSYEPFFVKNLENIQGDERDVIFISIGYAKDDTGKLTMNFGPLTNDGGERRLNVLITRARSRSEVFASIRSHEIDLSRTNARGTKSLKVFLEHAERNSNSELAAASTSQASSAVYSQPFENEIAKQLSGHGFAIEQHVGSTGLFIDVALVDPQNAERFSLGVECDGPDYQSARTARDRDRIRFDVLKRQGWNIQRVWSIDWLHRPQEQLQRLLKFATPEESVSTPASQPASTFGETIDRVDHAPSFENPCGVTEYRLANFAIDHAVSNSEAIHELPDKQIQSTIQRVVDVEGPIHVDEVAKRAAGLYGLKRTSPQLNEAIQKHIERMVAGSKLSREDDFVAIADRPAAVRDRSSVTQLRKPELIARAEIRSGVLAIVDAHFGATREDAIIETGRLFGFSATSPQLRERIDGEIANMLAANGLVELDGWLHSGSGSVLNAATSPHDAITAEGGS